MEVVKMVIKRDIRKVKLITERKERK